ncbi:zinc finger, c4 type (two domains) domain-containing protein [Ditylenchus destructor]|nr:zinc finger, c4 type (two domains) domain-containing protein [Ditylenchus destructor]
MKTIVQEIKLEPLNDDIFNSYTSHAPLNPNGFNSLLNNCWPTPSSQLCINHKSSLLKCEATMFVSNETELRLKRSHRKTITTKLENDVTMPTKCLVCGNPTNHYDVPSCNGCKVFFRRSLLALKRYVCQFNTICNVFGGIDRCRACRFDRCILLGYFQCII